MSGLPPPFRASGSSSEEKEDGKATAEAKPKGKAKPKGSAKAKKDAKKRKHNADDDEDEEGNLESEPLGKNDKDDSDDENGSASESNVRKRPSAKTKGLVSHLRYNILHSLGVFGMCRCDKEASYSGQIRSQAQEGIGNQGYLECGWDLGIYSGEWKDTNSSLWAWTFEGSLEKNKNDAKL